MTQPWATPGSLTIGTPVEAGKLLTSQVGDPFTVPSVTTTPFTGTATEKSTPTPSGTALPYASVTTAATTVVSVPSPLFWAPLVTSERTTSVGTPGVAIGVGVPRIGVTKSFGALRNGLATKNCFVALPFPLKSSLEVKADRMNSVVCAVWEPFGPAVTWDSSLRRTL